MKRKLFAFLCLFLPLYSMACVSFESDPDAFIHHCVNVINGDYSESAADLVITGPDALVLQRFYSTKDPITAAQTGAWRILPERFLVIGERGGLTHALTGERSGAILTYSGLKNEPLSIAHAPGMVNTYAKEINGRTNHQNNRLHYQGSACELILGDGTQRIYTQVPALPSLLLGEECTPLMAAQVQNPEYFHLTKEILPSGNTLFFAYDDAGHLISIEMKNKPYAKTLSWIHLTYDFQKTKCQVRIETSDAKRLNYHLQLESGIYQLKKVEGSHCIPVAYSYDTALIKKILPEGRFIAIEYEQGKVKTLKRPHALTGKPTPFFSFAYGEGCTDVLDALGTQTRYTYDTRFQLIAIDAYDEKKKLYRKEQKYWSDTGLLLAKSIGDANSISLFRSFQYDSSGNVIEEKLYGNLTGKGEIECHTKTFEYSKDGYNLLTRFGDCKGNQTLYSYQPGTNLLIKKLIYDRGKIKRRTFQSYNDDGACIQVIEDDGSKEKESECDSITERQIKKIKPKETLPSVGLPEEIEEKAFDLKKNAELLIRKQKLIYDSQSHLLSCATYDADEQYAFTETKTYSAIGQVISQTDALGREILYTYDAIGNETARSIPYANQQIATTYNYHNQPLQITKTTPEGIFTTCQNYDPLGRKISSSDRFGNKTQYEYDAFHRLTKVIYPEVLDENEQIASPTFNYSYDIFGQAIRIEDPKGYITEKSYTLRGDPTQIHYPDGTVELFKYDTEGSLHRSLSRDRIITLYEYDYLGRCVYEEDHALSETGSSTFLNSRSRKYNGFRCTHERDADLVKRYERDPAGRLAAVIEYGQNDAETRKTEFIYDSLGRVHQKKVWFDQEDYSLECLEYDLNHVIEKRIEDSKGNCLLKRGFSYDLQDRCTEEYSLEGLKTPLVQTSYNSEGEPISYLDGLSQETKITIDYAHLNTLGQKVLKKTIVNSLGVQTEIEFDALSRVCSLIKKDASGALLSSQKISYDLLGSKTCEIHDQIADGQIVRSHKIAYIFGPMGRLEEEIEAQGSPLEKHTLYQYNDLGKMISKTSSGQAIHYTYNKAGFLRAIKVGDQISNRYSYDRKGNIISAHSLHGKSVYRTYNAFNQVASETVKDSIGTYASHYHYDRKGRLKKITLPDESKIEYVYDAAFGREVRRISSQDEILYSHAYEQYDTQGKLLSERHIGNTGSTAYTYDENGQKTSSKNDFFSIQCARDSLGRLIEITGETPGKYVYNDRSQLTSEGKKSYAYDSLDNRIKVNNTELTYNDLNQLETCGQAAFAYDAFGNLLRKVLDGEETRYASDPLSQFISIEKEQTALRFSYDPFGRLLVEKELKKKKTLSTTRYLYFGHQEIGTLSETGDIETLKIPGLQDHAIAFEIHGAVYAPLHDLSGNVVGLIDPQNRTLVESYHYTAFGEESGEFSLIGNPWRFAEKRVDERSGLIFFGLRFYDPEIGRWISPDPAGYIDGPNAYAYLHNNPLNNIDRFGLATEALSPSLIDYVFGNVEEHCYCETHRSCKRGGDIGKTASSHLPKITYCETFEQMYPSYERSKVVDLSSEERPSLPEDLGIGFINGIWNSPEKAHDSIEYLSRFADGCNVHAVYNATHGKVPDVSECVLGLLFIGTDPVHQLHKMWNSFFDKSSANAKFLMICHSQGALHVRNALLDYPPELRKRVLVVAIAPAAYIYQETCAKVIHYRAHWWRDLIPRIDWFGALREKDSIVTLDSDPNAPFFDHGIMSPTYQDVLQLHILNYIQTNGKKL